MARIIVRLLLVCMTLAGCVSGAKTEGSMDKPSQTVTKDKAVAIAKAKAMEHRYFQNPHLESVQKQAKTDHWVIKFLSFDEKGKSIGAMYQYITIDKDTGAILAVDIGGGS